MKAKWMWIVAGVAACGLVVGACGGDGDEASSMADGQADSAAGAPADDGAATTATADPTEEPAADAPSEADAAAALFSSTVLPVMENSCASCHGVGGPGATHVELATAADAADNAEDIALQTVGRVMPPWPASHLSLEFEGDYSLTDDEIAAIQTWAAAGGPLDVDPDTPIVSTRPPAALGPDERDLVLTPFDGPYQGSIERPDDYRCLIYEPNVTKPEWILASHFEPDKAEVVHHGILTLASGELREQAATWDALDPGPGWTCYGGTGLTRAEGGYTFGLGGWAPGGQPNRRPEGYATPLNPGDFVIIQVHYHYDNPNPPADQSRLVLDLASEEEVAAQGGAYKRLNGSLYLGPAEIPCKEGDPDPLCDRDAAIARLLELYGPFGASLPDGMLNQCGQTPDEYAHMTTGRATSTCDLRVRNPGRIVSVTGHMHEIGESIRLTLNPDTPEERILLDIPNWNFEWQFGYTPVEEIIIDSDDIIRVDCAWDRDRNPFGIQGYVLWSEGTGDEMCYSSITTAPLD